MCRLIVFLLLTICSFTGQTQILNIESFRPGLDTSHYWAGNISLGFSLKKQINSVNTYSSAARIVYMSEHHGFFTINNFKLIQTDGTDLLSEGYTHWRAVLFRRKFLAYEPFVQYQYDLGRGLLHRQLAGVTLRFDLKSGDKTEVAFNTGMMYENERWQGAIVRFREEHDTTKAYTSFIKSTSCLLIRHKIADHVTLFGAAYYQARPDFFFKPRLIADMQLMFKIKKSFSFNVNYVMSYDELPAIESNRVLYQLDTALVYTFD